MRALLLSGACVGSTLAAASPAGSPAAAPAAATSTAPRPNIVVILVDDMGFSDIGPYGSEIPTPNLDALAAGGLRFTQFYNNARCSPSRASLMTGLYPHEAGMGGLDNVIVPDSRGLHGKLLDRSVTLAEVLDSAGYATAQSGKWHMGLNRGSAPWQRGFQHSFTPPGGLYFNDQPGKKTTYIDGRAVDTASDEVGKDYWYASDLLVSWGTKFAAEATAQHKPFFLYLPFTAPHFPLMAPPQDIARFKGKYLQGWDKLREARLARQKALGVLPGDEVLPDRLPVAYDWNRLSAPDKDRFDTMMAVYAAAISRMDKAVGDLVTKLKASGQYDNTLILFMSDNGGNAESGPDGKANAGPDKASLGSAGSTVWTGLNWATLQNTPFSYFKHYTEEGGISSPLIASWPKGIDANLRGSIVSAPGHLIDVMPTLVALSGAQYPAEVNRHAILPMEGRSFAPAFNGTALTREAPLFWEHEGNKAVRDGDWKLVQRFGEPWELYDIAHDRGESHDLAAAQPATVAKMAAQWDAWAERAFVDPWTSKVAGGVTPGLLDGGRKAPARHKRRARN